MIRRILYNLLSGPVAAPAASASPMAGGSTLSVFALDGGGCRGCMMEIAAMRSVAHDLERFGLRFVETPQHADVLLVGTAVLRNMAEAVALAYAAMPEPGIVVAVGDCAAGQGLFQNLLQGTSGGMSGVAGDAMAGLPVRLVISGCPPGPEQILSGLRGLMGDVHPVGVG